MAKDDLRNMGGSFMSPQMRQDFHEQVQGASPGFHEALRKSQEASSQKRGESLEKLIAKQTSGKLNEETDADQEGSLLSEEDVYGKKRDALSAEDFSEEEDMHAPHASEEGEEDSEEDEESAFQELDDGTRICKTCGTVVESPSLVPISDDELVTYMLGSRILREFSIGPLKIVLRSLTQDELDHCSIQIAVDKDNEEFPTMVEYNNRLALYQLAFALMSIHSTKCIDPSSAKDPESMQRKFEDKVKFLKDRGHHIVMKLTTKVSVFENSINRAIEDMDRIKN